MGAFAASGTPAGEGISGICPAWSAAEDLGRLDGKFISEASGLAVSRRFGKLYHVNDSGDGPRFFVTERDGTGTRGITIRDFKPRDVEEIALGPCPGGDTCLAIADIGDNRRRRKLIEVLFVKETEEWGEEVDAVARLWLKYPDQAHDAEAIAILPNKDLIIVTKELVQMKSSFSAHVFRLRAPYKESSEKKPLVLESLGRIDVPSMIANKGLDGAVTAMSVSTDGKRVAFLTYGNALEVALDLSAAKPKLTGLKRGKDFSTVTLLRLAQQEGVSYDVNERDLIYTSETIFRLLGARDPIAFRRVRCQKGKK